MSSEIELAAPEDAELICRIRDEAWIETYPNAELGITAENVRMNAQGRNGEFVPRRIAWFKKKIAEPGDDWVAYVGKIDDVVRGFIVATRDDNGRPFILMVYVQPGFQGQGLGGKLMQAALHWLGAGTDIYLEVVSYNQDAIRFYERFGFQKTGIPVEEEANRPDYITPIPATEMVLKAQ
jgi:ribosomal protein S18 acetylase RimI-like enzyme